jgi:hypothetical protein
MILPVLFFAAPKYRKSTPKARLPVRDRPEAPFSSMLEWKSIIDTRTIHGQWLRRGKGDRLLFLVASYNKAW